MTDAATGVVSEIISAFTASGPSDTQMAVDPTNAEIRNTLPFADVDLDDEVEYQRLKRAEEKAFDARFRGASVILYSFFHSRFSKSCQTSLRRLTGIAPKRLNYRHHA